ncbi:hypothetical protein MN116_007158 [Schistosoma mekongi]|uniref:Threonine aspartase 1 n=1 Tax=Schistosoma mekongi TaxID=38744 RepID=A0AAE1Z8K9_SCHME|nr:hypothetical protein MN116_007158 [Schistosoma mekongi]
MACVVVHAGAGYHSKSKEKKYNKLCSEACLLAGKLLSVDHKGAIDAVEAAVAYLEDCPLTNAGTGSNLSINGYVECDAGIMSGSGLRFAGVGAVRNMRNPIKVARLLLQSQIDHPLGELGRVPPSLLVGDGAHLWASSKGYSIDNKNLVTKNSLFSWEKYKSWLFSGNNIDTTANDPHFINHKNCPAPKRSCTHRFDTVGAVCIDLEGKVAAAVSSGGIAMKYEGRLGQACAYGCGCWAEEINPFTRIGVVTSGTGEQLVRTQLAQRSAERFYGSSICVPDVIQASLIEGFLNSKYLSCDMEKFAGVAGVYANFERPNFPVIEVFFGHSTRSMSIGHYLPSVMTKPSVHVSRKLMNKPIHLEVSSYSP